MKNENKKEPRFHGEVSEKSHKNMSRIRGKDTSIEVILRKAFGGAYIGMDCKSLGADFVFAWPIAQIAVMGAEGAINIIANKKIEASENPEEARKKAIEEYEEKFMNPYVAAERGYVDEVIRPDETKSRVLNAFRMLSQKSVNTVPKKHGNIPL